MRAKGRVPNEDQVTWSEIASICLGALGSSPAAFVALARALDVPLASPLSEAFQRYSEFVQPPFVEHHDLLSRLMGESDANTITDAYGLGFVGCAILLRMMLRDHSKGKPWLSALAQTRARVARRH
jgi:hypothetical protein